MPKILKQTEPETGIVLSTSTKIIALFIAIFSLVSSSVAVYGYLDNIKDNTLTKDQVEHIANDLLVEKNAELVSKIDCLQATMNTIVDNLEKIQENEELEKQTLLKLLDNDNTVTQQDLVKFANDFKTEFEEVKNNYMIMKRKTEIEITKINN